MSLSASRIVVRSLTRRGGYGFQHLGSEPFLTSFRTLSQRALPRATRHHTKALISGQSGRIFLKKNTFSSPRVFLQNIRYRLFHYSRVRRTTTPPKSNPTSQLNSPPKEEHLSLSQRLKKLSREYGWAAVGVYLGLSALDFPFCYLLVRYLGANVVGEWEHYIVSNVSKAIPESIKSTYRSWMEAVRGAEKQTLGNQNISDHVEMAGWGIQQAEEQNKTHASLATQLALAYAIHKSFIFIRVPLTAAVTPRVVKTLRSWGWNIGKRTPKAQRAINKGANSS